jgi:predicted neuraminidase
LLQPTFLMQSPTHWLALMRDHRPDGHVGVAQTLDGGKNWQDLPDLALVNPDAAVNGLGLADGSMVLVHNSSPHSRSLLDVSASTDGVRWNSVAALAHGQDSDEYSYPGLTWADGALWVSYTDHRKYISWQRLVPVSPMGGQP